MATHLGQCYCAGVVFSLALPKPLSTYPSWQCDCEFCTNNNLAYLADPAGEVQITSNAPLVVNKQGSKQASFLSCASCGTYIAVTCQCNKALKGAVNAALLVDSAQLKKAITVSPKLLDPQEKVNNWAKLWLSVRINNIESNG